VLVCPAALLTRTPTVSSPVPATGSSAESGTIATPAGSVVAGFAASDASP